MPAYPHIARYYGELSELIDLVRWLMRKISARRSKTVLRPTALSTLSGWCSYLSCGRIVAISLVGPFGTPCA